MLVQRFLKLSYYVNLLSKDCKQILRNPKKIKERLLSTFMFMSFEQQDLKVVIDAMDEKKVFAYEKIINEGNQVKYCIMLGREKVFV